MATKKDNEQVDYRRSAAHERLASVNRQMSERAQLAAKAFEKPLTANLPMSGSLELAAKIKKHFPTLDVIARIDCNEYVSLYATPQWKELTTTVTDLIFLEADVVKASEVLANDTYFPQFDIVKSFLDGACESFKLKRELEEARKEYNDLRRDYREFYQRTMMAARGPMGCF